MSVRLEAAPTPGAQVFQQRTWNGGGDRRHQAIEEVQLLSAKGEGPEYQ